MEAPHDCPAFRRLRSKPGFDWLAYAFRGRSSLRNPMEPKGPRSCAVDPWVFGLLINILVLREVSVLIQPYWLLTSTDLAFVNWFNWLCCFLNHVLVFSDAPGLARTSFWSLGTQPLLGYRAAFQWLVSVSLGWVFFFPTVSGQPKSNFP